MGLFDDIGELIGAIKEPIQDIGDTVQQVKDDAAASFGQVSDDVTSIKEQGQAAIDDVTGAIRGDSEPDSGE